MRPSRPLALWFVLGVLVSCQIAGTAWLSGGRSLAAETEAETEDVEIALALATMLRAARTVISSHQDLINDPEIGDKGLTGKAVIAEATEQFRKETATDPTALDPQSRKGRLLRAQMDAIVEVVDAHQHLINQQGVGFKGFVPAVFARLVNEAFEEKLGREVHVKVTAPPELVRNRKARPDAWETEVIQSKFLDARWPHGQVFWTDAPRDGRDAFRIMVPEYYTAGCLTCHGQPKGEIDITGYPKEGRELGELGGAISITLFR